MDNNDSGVTTPSDTDAREHLQQLAEAADRGEGPNPLEVLPSADKGGEGDSKTTDNRASESNADNNNPDNPEPSADNKKTDDGQQPRDEKGKFTKKEGDQQPPDDGKQGKESNYNRAKKDQERQDRSWKALEAEKERVRAREAELARQAQELERSRQAPNPNNQPRFSSQHLMKAVQTFEAEARKALQEGDPEEAAKQLDLASKARTEAQRSYQAEVRQAQEQQATEFGKQWQADTEGLIKDNPELANPQSKDGQELIAMLQQEPYLGFLPDGARKAWTVITLRREAAEASGLRDKLAKAEKEIERLNSLVSPQGGRGTGTHAGAKKFNDLNEAEQKAYLERRAREADDAA